MKIGILTTVHAYNYGAQLQAYSLQKFIENNTKHNCELISFNPCIRRDIKTVFYPNKNLRNVVKNFLMLLSPSIIKKKKDRLKKFDEFKRNELVTNSDHYASYEELEKVTEDYDCIICGSDQIWNMSIFPKPVYFLDFTKDSAVKRVSYAASVVQPIANDKLDVVRECLQKFSAISVREREDVRTCQELSGKEVYRVIDPVFLNNIEFWVSKQKPYKVKESYILCYFLGGENAAQPIIEYLSKQTGLKVCMFNIGYKKMPYADYDCSDADPFEFLSLIKNATLICTNSFHCTAFSILFKKNFYLMNMNNKRSTRMLNLIEDYDLKDRIISASHLPEEITDIEYDEVEKKLKILRNQSISFLNDALK